MSEAILGIGTVLAYSAHPTPTTYTPLAEVYSVGWPEVTGSDVKVTHYLSPGNVHEYIAGFSEGGEVAVEANYVGGELATAYSLKGVTKTWKITLPDGATVVFPGYVKSVGAEIPVEDRITSKLTIKVAGEPTFTEGV